MSDCIRYYLCVVPIISINIQKKSANKFFIGADKSLFFYKKVI